MIEWFYFFIILLVIYELIELFWWRVEKLKNNNEKVVETPQRVEALNESRGTHDTTSKICATCQHIDNRFISYKNYEPKYKNGDDEIFDSGLELEEE